MIFTALLLLLCQEPTGDKPISIEDGYALIGRPAVVMAQAPALRLSSETNAEYRLAMHLIDVRGNYGNGAAHLLQLVDKPDVILVPGQASWMLAQAARALTLDGRTEDAALYIPGARNGSRGTEFQKPIDELLASFAPQSAGLDPEFLEFVKLEMGVEKGPNKLFQAYRQDLGPYLWFIVENQQGDFSLIERQRALNILFTVLDQPTAARLIELFSNSEVLELRGLLQVFQGMPNAVFTFRDEESRASSADVLIQLANQVPDELKNLALDALIKSYGCKVFSSDSIEVDEVGKRIGKAVLGLIESGYRGDKGNAYYTIIRWQQSSENSSGSLTDMVANSEVAEVREDFRWEIARSGRALDLLRQWAVPGESMDQLRLALMAHKDLGSMRDNQGFPLYRDLFTWFDTLQFGGKPVPPFIGKRRSRQESLGDLPALATMASSEEPLIKYLAASTLLRNKQIDDVFLFLENLGEDPQWASFILREWTDGRDSRLHLTPEMLDVIVGLSREGTLQTEARALLAKLGDDVMTVALWRELSLTLTEQAGRVAIEKANAEGAVSDLIWVMVNSEVKGNYYHRAANHIAQNWPKEFLQTIPLLEEAGRRNLVSSYEQRSWRSAAEIVGADLFLEFENEIESAILQADLQARNAGVAIILVDKNPDLAIRIIARNWRDSEVVLKLIVDHSILQRFRNVQNKGDSTQLVLELLRAEILSPFADRVESPFPEIVDPSHESYPEIMAQLWAQVGGDDYHNLTSFLISESIQKPILREKFKTEIHAYLRKPKWTSAVLSWCNQEGAFPWIFEETLAMLEDELATETLIAVLNELDAIDDERAINSLLQYVKDPRPRVRYAAANSLEKIKTIRASAVYWDSWSVDGKGPKLSPVAALMVNLKDPDLEIRLVSIESLGTLGDKEALPALINLLRDENEQIKDATRKALDRINKNDDHTVKAQLTVRLTELEGELLSLQSRFTDEHPQVVGMKSKIKVVKDQLAALEKEQED